MKKTKISSGRLTRLARKEIRELKGYEIDNQSCSIKLDANENPYSPEIKSFPKMSFNKYPECQPVALIERLSSLYDADKEKILVSRGSDESIDLLIKAFCKAYEDKVMIFPPTFSMYEIYAKIQGVKLLKIPLLPENDYEIKFSQIEKDIRKTNPKILFIPNPNSPIGKTMNKDNLLEIAEKLQDKALVVIDEAYIEFSKEKSMTRYLEKSDNLVILRTLSKAYGMASLRLGVCIADNEITRILRRIQAPYSIPAPCYNIALECLSAQNMKKTGRRIRIIKDERERLSAILKNFSFIDRLFESNTNFVFIQLNNPLKLWKFCKSRGILLKFIDNEMQGIRITIGNMKENDTLISAFREYEENPDRKKAYYKRK
ncbi:MAG: histidinol-phosphate transaminase [Candidatus Coatesbacteria bacterium]|nr:histidinol-phosphate transaminase [Candidatus Coatesbacteria bacterium]